MLLTVCCLGLGEQPIRVADPKSEAPTLGLSDLVVLAPDYARHSDAREGPLSPGQIGVVVEVGSSRLRVKARSGDDRKWWYVLSKLQHCADVPAVAALRSCSCRCCAALEPVLLQHCAGVRAAAFVFVPFSCG